MISGPIPAQSPSVIPMRRLLVLLLILLLLLVILVELIYSITSALTSMSEARVLVNNPRTAAPESASELLDIGFLSQAGEPTFLNLLSLFLDQFFLDVGAHFIERLCAAAVFILKLQDVVIAGVIDDVADSSDRHVEGKFLQRLRQSFAFDPAPVA